MSSIIPYKHGYRAFVLVNGGKRKSKTFRTRREANQWALAQEADNSSGRIKFSDLTESWLKTHLTKITSKSNKRNIVQTLDDYVLPYIGNQCLSDIKRRDLIAVIKQLADVGKVETAGRVAQRIRAIFDYAVDIGEIESHPAAGMSRVLPSAPVKHMAAIAPNELPDLMKAIEGYNEPVTRIGLRLLAHTFVRTTELVGARWSEIDNDTWVIAAERMKMRKPHVVPLSNQVIDLLDTLKTYTGEEQYLLASPTVRGKPVSTNTLLYALYRLGYRGRMTGHGFRTIASSILNESGKWAADAIERQLAHKETDAVRAAYHRAEYLDERRRMMQWWSDYLAV